MLGYSQENRDISLIVPKFISSIDNENQKIEGIEKLPLGEEEYDHSPQNIYSQCISPGKQQIGSPQQNLAIKIRQEYEAGNSAFNPIMKNTIPMSGQTPYPPTFGSYIDYMPYPNGNIATGTNEQLIGQSMFISGSGSPYFSNTVPRCFAQGSMNGDNNLLKEEEN